MKNPIKILIVEDSAVVRDFLVYILSSEPDMYVVGTAKNGQEAIRLAELKKPDIITMDVEMPVMNGLEATRQIMSNRAVPIVMVTASYSKSEVQKTFNALEAGALAILAKPGGVNHPDYKENRAQLVKTVRLMAEVKVVTRRSYKYKSQAGNQRATSIKVDESKTNYKITSIGISTGGPPALNLLLSRLPANYNMPVVVVQHIPEGFLEGMVDWLNQSSKMPVKIAENGEALKPGNVYFCPAAYHMGVTKDMTIELKKEVPHSSIRPSVSYMFHTIGKNIKDRAIGILMTGMGRDGAEELAIMKEKGALTIIQDEISSVVWGMPGEAFNLNAHKYILTPENIALKLIELNK